MIETIITTALSLLFLACMFFYYIVGIVICFGVPIAIFFGIFLTTNIIYNYITSKTSRKI